MRGRLTGLSVSTRCLPSTEYSVDRMRRPPRAIDNMGTQTEFALFVPLSPPPPPPPFPPLFSSPFHLRLVLATTTNPAAAKPSKLDPPLARHMDPRPHRNQPRSRIFDQRPLQRRKSHLLQRLLWRHGRRLDRWAVGRDATDCRGGE